LGCRILTLAKETRVPDATGRPRRKRLSWESRCEVVAKVRLQGMSPELAAASSGVHRATVYRLLGRFDAGGWGGPSRAPAGAPSPAAPHLG
jgi:transposase